MNESVVFESFLEYNTIITQKKYFEEQRKVSGISIQSIPIENHRNEVDESSHLYLFLNFLQKAIKYIESTELTYDTQLNVMYMVDIILTATDPENEYIHHPDVQRIFYSNCSTDVLFNLITKDYDCNIMSAALRFKGYKILCNNLRNNVSKARTSIKLWLGDPKNKCIFFDRFTRVVKNFMSTYNKPELNEVIGECIELSDYNEIFEGLNFLTLLSYKEYYWQEYIEFQPGIMDHAIFEVISDLIGTLVQNLKHEFCLNMIIQNFKFVLALISENNDSNKTFFVNSHILDHIQKLLEIGYFAKTERGLMYFDLDRHQTRFRNGTMSTKVGQDAYILYENNRKINEMKFYALKVANNLISKSTSINFKNYINLETLDKIMKFGYLFLTTNFNLKYTSDLLKSDHSFRNAFWVEIPFLCLYLSRRIQTDKTFRKEYNIVKIESHQWRVSRYIEIMWQWVFKMKYSKNYLNNCNIVDFRYDEDETLRKAVQYFDSHSSHVEVIVSEGKRSLIKYFEISPIFLAFSNQERQDFWLETNLEDPKTFCYRYQEY